MTQIRKPDLPKDSGRDPVHVALNYALGRFLSTEAKETVLLYLEIKHKISIGSKVPLSAKEVEYALVQFFGGGANIILAEFRRKFDDLASKQKTSIA